MKKIELIALKHDCCAVCKYYTEEYCSINCGNPIKDCSKCKYDTLYEDCQNNIYCPYIENSFLTICTDGNFKRREK